MKLRSALSVSTSALMILVGACDRQPEPSVKNKPAAQVPDDVSVEPVPRPAPPVPTTAAQSKQDTQGEQGGTDDWRKVMSAQDKDLLARIDEAWGSAIGDARNEGFGMQVKALGAVASKDAAAQGRLQPAPGNYRCRTIKIGRRGNVGLGYVDYPYFRCLVELTPGGDLIIEKTTGSQRFRGLLYPDSDRRLVYVGTQAWGDEKGFPTYGAQAERDESGALERIGDNHWRLVIPFPKQESQLNIIEIVR